MDGKYKWAELAKGFSLLTQIGMTMVVCILGCSLVGIWIDGKLGTKPLVTLVMIILGVLSAFMSLHRTLKSYTKKGGE